MRSFLSRDNLLSRDRKGADVTEVRDRSAPWLGGGELRSRLRRGLQLGRGLRRKRGLRLLAGDSALFCMAASVVN